MTAPRIDVGRLIRIVTLLLSVAAVASVYAAYAPRIDALLARIDDGREELRSDEVARREATRLRAERVDLARTYAPLLSQNAEAVFVRELATMVRRRGVTLVSTNAASDSGSHEGEPAGASFSRVRLTVDLRGSYRALLATVAELSTGSEIAEVGEPNLRRDGDAIAATIPVVVYEPRRTTAAPSVGTPK